MKLDGPLADRDVWRAARCSIDLALTVVGTRSAMLLLREAFYGTTRFHDFASRVGITEAVAASRLKDLVEIGVFEKRPYREEGQRTRHEYLLTDKGRALLPAILALMQWGDAYLQDDGGPFRWSRTAPERRCASRCARRTVQRCRWTSCASGKHGAPIGWPPRTCRTRHNPAPASQSFHCETASLAGC